MVEAVRRRSATLGQEFSMLERLLLQTADDISKCLKVLKKGLGKFDSRNLPGFHYRSTSKYCLKVDIRVVKEMVSELRQVAKRISRSKSPSQSEVNAARISMNAAADALSDLNRAGQIYDENRGLDRQEAKMGDGKTSKNADTVETLVKSTLRENFTGFRHLEKQISIVEKALLPW
ncbi:hypothetical protein V7S43_014403 [Phytophthora oleae]|uniref:Syntaxin N-terminal domain-containing protein n=1 Tax=Phytophthora oleae TaxID=2107226 RepID=A0ABD3F1J2_9STRA